MSKHIATINELAETISMMEDDALSAVSEEVSTFCSEIQWVFELFRPPSTIMASGLAVDRRPCVAITSAICTHVLRRTT